ncbi:cation:proton antiporter [Candidatus Woesearchaeota archaeon]|nr:cation:proton antiporter [Candidatus Woesearchaeota archaeon]
MNTDITAVITEWGMVTVLTVIALGGTVLGSVIGVMLSRQGTAKEGFIVGWGVSPKGDVELVIASLALAQGIITKNVFSALIMMALFTTILAPVFFRGLLRKHKEKMSAD